MSDSIPEDICETAYELAFVWAMPDEAALTRCTDAIARAILAERERCARIADIYANTKAVAGPHAAIIATVTCETGAQIAAAIRNPERD